MLGRLTALVSQLRSTGPDEDAREAALEIGHFFSTTVRRHHEDEERHVFPPLLAGGDPEIVQAVLSLQQDHHWLDVDWAELSPRLSAVATGQTGLDLDTLHEGVEIFAALLLAHIALEESCIYPKARSRLGGVERKEMSREMAERRRALRKPRPATV